MKIKDPVLLKTNVILRPLDTEKLRHLRERQNKYAFQVNLAANKAEIKSAVEAAFGVKVTDVKVMNFQGKPRRKGRFLGRTANWKKAIVTLIPQDKITIFENI